MKVTEFPGLSNQNEKGMLKEKMYGGRAVEQSFEYCTSSHLIDSQGERCLKLDGMVKDRVWNLGVVNPG